MNSSSRAFAIVASVVIIVLCLIFACVKAVPTMKLSNDIDQTKTGELASGDTLKIDSAVSSVTVTADAAATGVTAHLHGSMFGLSIGSAPELEVVRDGSDVTIRAGRNWVTHIGFSANMKLDVVVPANFSGRLDAQSSAGPVLIGSDFKLSSFRAHSSAGSVKAGSITATGAVEASSSAGSVELDTIVASSADISSSAGRVYVKSCKADTIKLHSSAGSVSGDDLSGKMEVSSSAGSVSATLRDVVGSADIYSSAGAVHVTLPKTANANLNAYSSAGSVSVNDLTLVTDTQKHDKVNGRLGDGGAEVTVHSSAGSVDVNGK